MKKSIKRIIALISVIALLACTFAACSKTDNETETKAPEENSKTWIIAMDTVFKPFEYTDAKGNFVGIDVDIINAVAEDQGINIDIRSLGWDAAIAACQAGQADGMIAGASITDERVKEGWIFSDPYYTATQCVAVAKDSDIKTLDDLKGKKVAVKNGTQGEAYAKSIADKYGFEITVYEDSPTMYQTVTGGQEDACFEDTPIMAFEINQGTQALQIVEGSENEGGGYGFAIFNADNQELLDAFNKGLANIKANGTYDKILANYLG